MTNYSELSNEEINVLVAQAMGWKRKESMWVGAHSGWVADFWNPSECSVCFEVVKREIERRDWQWISEYSSSFEFGPHRFQIYPFRPWARGFGDSELRVGCEAFLLAVETTRKEEAREE